jgi:hypothetical protein
MIQLGGMFLHYFHRVWYTCETVRLTKMWLDDVCFKAQTRKNFSGTVTVHIGVV